jgi:hypothetical protein
VGVLKARDHSELTLVTCYPFNYIGSAPKRFIVKAEQVPLVPIASQIFKEVIVPVSAHSTKSEKHIPGVRRVTFEVSASHSRQLVPGISLGLTGTNAANRRANGWMWLTPDDLAAQPERSPAGGFLRLPGW